MNCCFYYLLKDDDVKCLSIVFDFVMFYGENLDLRLDIFGKIGESGVNVCMFDDMKFLYKGFDFCYLLIFVLMMINGLVLILLVMFMNIVIC